MELLFPFVVLACSQVLLVIFLPAVHSLEETPIYNQRKRQHAKRNGAVLVNEDLAEVAIPPRQRQLTQVGDEPLVETFPVWDSNLPWWLDLLNITGEHGNGVVASSSSSLQADDSGESSSANSGSAPSHGGGETEEGGEMVDLDFLDLGRTLGAERPQTASRYLANRKMKNKKKKKSKNYAKAYIPLRKSHKNTILLLHNTFRAGVSGPPSNMEELKWDNNLETMARQYAKKCRWEHGQVTNVSPWSHVGQNLAYGIGREFTPFYLIRLWHNEVHDYNVMTGYCTPGKPCGHYIQMVWAETKYVGCAVNFCKSLYDPNRDRKMRDAVYLVCNYGPGGNYAGESPYKMGEPCTECPSWSGKCRDGLCSDCDLSTDSCECAIQCYNGGTLNEGSCRCECPAGWTGPQCNTVCNNTHPYCGNGWPRDWCFKDDDDNPVEEYCPALCGVCECGGPTCENGGTKDPSTCECECVHPWSGSQCQECNLQCDHGQLDPDGCSCQCEAGWMGETCSDECGNSHQLCYNGWYINWCNDDHPYVLKYCKAMCGVCDIEVDEPKPEAACEDTFVHCRWSKSFCNSNPDFGRNFCPLSCGFCGTDGNELAVAMDNNEIV